MKKILIVEDNAANMKLFCDVLEYKNYSVEKATDGLEAYEKIKSMQFDLVVLDIQLPKLDGLSLLKKIKEENINRPKIHYINWLCNVILTTKCFCILLVFIHCKS